VKKEISERESSYGWKVIAKSSHIGEKQRGGMAIMQKKIYYL
jgi:hypothetical protein